jgi:hypothetical protein
MLGFTTHKNKIIGSNEKYLGDLIQRLQINPAQQIGYTMMNKTIKVPFVKTHNIITGASILNIPSGVWSICFGWKITYI